MILATFVATIFIPLFFTWLTNENQVRHHVHVEAEIEDVK
jgi:multidrug efflux pump